VSSADALEVIRILREKDVFGEGEQPVSPFVASASTRTFAAVSANLPTRVLEVETTEIELPPADLGLGINSRDRILAAGLQLVSPIQEWGLDSLDLVGSQSTSESDVDAALSVLFGNSHLLELNE
jgi:hypothetical protein